MQHYDAYLLAVLNKIYPYNALFIWENFNAEFIEDFIQVAIELFNENK